MLSFLASCSTFIETGLVMSLIAMGYYVSYAILDFPDMTVEGTFLSGAVIFGLLTTNHVSPWLALIVSFLVGAAFGALTGVLHVKLNIRPLLCGILVSTALISVNLVVTGIGQNGSSIISYGANAPLHKDILFSYVPAKIGNTGIILRDIVIFLLIVAIFKVVLDLFLGTKCGLLLRATGNNSKYVTSLAKDAGKMKILGLAIGNAFAAVSGAMYSNISGNVNQSMGIGMVVIGLASLIIGLSLFSKVRFLKPTTKVIIGSIIYQACLTIAIKLGLPSEYNKLLMAVLFTIALILSNVMKKERKGK